MMSLSRGTTATSSGLRSSGFVAVIWGAFRLARDDARWLLLIPVEVVLLVIALLMSFLWPAMVLRALDAARKLRSIERKTREP
jgi:hypothetical protein